jgi:hypothetical protein
MPIQKLTVLSRVVESGLVAIVRTDSPEQAARIADACAEAGVAALEVTFVPGRGGHETSKRYRPLSRLARKRVDPEIPHLAGS